MIRTVSSVEIKLNNNNNNNNNNKTNKQKKQKTKKNKKKKKKHQKQIVLSINILLTCISIILNSKFLIIVIKQKNDFDAF